MVKRDTRLGKVSNFYEGQTVFYTCPKCDHKLCIDCFKRCYYGDDDLEAKENEPQFPYPDIEDEYYDDQDNSRWEIDYPLIEKYNKDWNEWDNNKQSKYNTENYLRMCTLCRK
jgi:hypothetical protein